MFAGLLLALLAAATLLLALVELLLWGNLHCRLSPEGLLAPARRFLFDPAGIAIAAVVIVFAVHLARVSRLLRTAAGSALRRAGDRAARLGLSGLFTGIAGAAWVFFRTARQLAGLDYPWSVTDAWLGEAALSLGVGALLGLAGTAASLVLCTAARRRDPSVREPVGPGREVAIVLLLAAALTARESLAFPCWRNLAWPEAMDCLLAMLKWPLLGGVAAAVLAVRPWRARWTARLLPALVLVAALYGAFGTGPLDGATLMSHGPDFGGRVGWGWLPWPVLAVAALVFVYRIGPRSWRIPRAPFESVAAIGLAAGLVMAGWSFAGIFHEYLPEWGLSAVDARSNGSEAACASLFAAGMIGAALLAADPESPRLRLRGAGIASAVLVALFACAAVKVGEAFAWRSAWLGREYFRHMAAVGTLTMAGGLVGLAPWLVGGLVRFVREGAVPTRPR